MAGRRRGSIGWRAGVGLVAAAVGSMATSQPEWDLSADLPPARQVAAGQSLVYRVEASQDPFVGVKRLHAAHVVPAAEWAPSYWARVDAGAQPAWSGSREFDLFEGDTLESVAIGGIDCGGGCNECAPPDDAFVRVLGPEPRAAWRESRSLTGIPPVPSPQRCVSVLQVRLEGAADAHLLLDVTYGPSGYIRKDRLSVFPTAPGVIEIDPFATEGATLVVTATGACPSLDPCGAPAFEIESATWVKSTRYTCTD